MKRAYCVSLKLITVLIAVAFSVVFAIAETTSYRTVATYVSTDGFALAGVPDVSPVESTGGAIEIRQDPATGIWRAYSGGVESDYTGFASNAYGTWYCDNGIVDFEKDGFIESNGNRWRVREGRVLFEVSGSFSDDYYNYTIEQGRVVSKSLKDEWKAAITLGSVLVITAIAILSSRKKKKSVKNNAVPKYTPKEESIVNGEYTKDGSDIPKDYYKRPENAAPSKPKIRVTAKPKNPLSETEAAKGSTQLPYRKKYLLTKNEYRFYKSLRPIADTLGLDVLAKIRMGDLVEPMPNWNRSEWYTQWGRIKARHVDFALVDPSSLYVKLLIELDDNSHNSVQAKETDQFKNDVYASAGYKLLRVRSEEGLEEKFVGN